MCERTVHTRERTHCMQSPEAQENLPCSEADEHLEIARESLG